MPVCVGPQYWPEIAPAAAGNRQSPILIRSHDAQFDHTLIEYPLDVSYDGCAANKLENNGHTVQVVVGGDDSSESL